MIGTTLFLLLTSAWAGTLRDNFDDGNFEGWRLHKFADQTAQWSVEKGELICISKNFCAGLPESELITDEETWIWKNYVFECQFKIGQTFPTGCRPSIIGIGVYSLDAGGDNGFFSYVAKTGSGWNSFPAFIVHQGSQINKGNVGTIPIEEGKWYTARAIVGENRYQMFFDGVLIHDLQATLPNQGGVGVTVANCEAHFDNVVITGDGIPDKNLGLAVEPKAKLATMWGQMKALQ